jgi:hypothetical protein
MPKRILALVAGAVSAWGCGSVTFKEDLRFLERHTETVVLHDKERWALVAVCPALQGRVMTSSASGVGGLSFGWLNYELIASGALEPHINAYGGEDRFWLGPEGGPYSIFFEKGAGQDLASWQTPAPIDSEPWVLAERTDTRAQLRKSMKLRNASGALFELDVRREIRLFLIEEAWKEALLAPRRGVNVVAYESDNRITNTGREAWTRETGCLSIWILGMFRPSPSTTVVLPFRKGPGPFLNDVYFGKIPADRLKVREEGGDGIVFFKGDGQMRGKVGIPPRRARTTFGSWDAEQETLTLVQYTLSEGAAYVNSVWGAQKDPYAGDAVNSYNDGPPEPGKPPLGPFYELESSSPAAALKPGQSARHTHRTFHFAGPRAELDLIARATLGCGLEEIEAAFLPASSP